MSWSASWQIRFMMGSWWWATSRQADPVAGPLKRLGSLSYEDFKTVCTWRLIVEAGLLPSSGLVGLYGTWTPEPERPPWRRRLRRGLLVLCADGRLRFANIESGVFVPTDTGAVAFSEAPRARPASNGAVGIASAVDEPTILLPLPQSLKSHCRALARAVLVASGNQLDENWPLATAIARVEYARLRRLTHPFLRLLDPAVVALMIRAGLTSVQAYNDLIIPNTGLAGERSEPAREALYRRQAITTYPLLAPILLNDAHLRRSIETGARLIPAIRNGLGLPPALIRRVGRQSSRALPLADYQTDGQAVSGTEADLSLQTVLAALQQMPPALYPRTPADWHGFLLLLSLDRAWQRSWFGRIAETTAQQRLVDLFAGRWPQAVRQLFPEQADGTGTPTLQGVPAVRQLESLIKDAGGLVTILRDRLCLPVARIARATPVCPTLRAEPSGRSEPDTGSLTSVADRLAKEMLFGDLSPVAILAKTVQIRRVETLFRPRPLLVWSSLCPAQTAPNGLRLVFLTSSLALDLEGAQLDHCAGLYASSCALDGSHVLSIRDPAGRSLSTAELAPVQKSMPVRVRQHKGPANGAPPHACRVALAWLVGRLNRGALPIDADRLAAACRVRRRNSVSGRPAAGPHSETLLATAALWRRMLEPPWSTVSTQTLLLMIAQTVETTELSSPADAEMAIS